MQVRTVLSRLIFNTTAQQSRGVTASAAPHHQDAAAGVRPELGAELAQRAQGAGGIQGWHRQELLCFFSTPMLMILLYS